MFRRRLQAHKPVLATACVNPGDRLVDDPDRVHPLARRMAMAIRCQQLIDAGVVADQASLAAVAGMTRAWITVVMRLNLLAPDIQEEILHLSPDDPADHMDVQAITRFLSWESQRLAWCSRRRFSSGGRVE